MCGPVWLPHEHAEVGAPEEQQHRGLSALDSLAAKAVVKALRAADKVVVAGVSEPVDQVVQATVTAPSGGRNRRQRAGRGAEAGSTAC